MKTLSLQLDDILYQETEKLLEELKKPRNRYINDALKYYNRVQRKIILEKLLEKESNMVGGESMNVLSDFEKIED